MCTHFAGFGGDIELANGLRLSAWGQQRLGMNFLRILQKDFGHLTINEVAAYCFILHSTILGDQVGVKDVSAELDIPMSSASYLLLRLEDMRLLESYPCTEDKRRKWLRLHSAVVARRVSGGEDAWRDQRQLLREILEEEGGQIPSSSVSRLK